MRTHSFTQWWFLILSLQAVGEENGVRLILEPGLFPKSSPEGSVGIWRKKVFGWPPAQGSEFTWEKLQWHWSTLNWLRFRKKKKLWCDFQGSPVGGWLCGVFLSDSNFWLPSIWQLLKRCWVSAVGTAWRPEGQAQCGRTLKAKQNSIRSLSFYIGLLLFSGGPRHKAPTVLWSSFIAK